MLTSTYVVYRRQITTKKNCTLPICLERQQILILHLQLFRLIQNPHGCKELKKVPATKMLITVN